MYTDFANASDNGSCPIFNNLLYVPRCELTDTYTTNFNRPKTNIAMAQRLQAPSEPTVSWNMTQVDSAFLIKLWGLWRLSPVQRIRSAILSKTLLTKSFTKYFAYLTSSVCVGLSKEVSHFFSVHLYRVLREVNSFHRCLSLNKRTPLRTAQCHILHLDKMAANWDVLNGSRLMHLTGGEVRSIITHYDFEDVISSEYGSLQWWLIVRLWSSVW